MSLLYIINFAIPSIYGLKYSGSYHELLFSSFGLRVRIRQN